MKYIINLVFCILLGSALLCSCDFGKPPNLEALYGTEECDEECMAFESFLVTKYGGDWDTMCDEKCQNEEYYSFLESYYGDEYEEEEEGEEGELLKAVDAGQCDEECMAFYESYISFLYGAECDEECKESKFKDFLEWFYGTSEEVTETEAQPKAGVSENNAEEGIKDEASGEEKVEETTEPTDDKEGEAEMLGKIHVLMNKLDFVPDSLVILPPNSWEETKLNINNWDSKLKNGSLSTEEKVILSLLPDIMSKSEYTVLAYKGNSGAGSLIIVRGGSAIRDLLKAVSGKYKIASSRRDLIKLEDGIGLAVLDNSILFGVPYDRIKAVKDGPASLISIGNTSYKDCIAKAASAGVKILISALPKQEVSFKPDPLEYIFDLSGQRISIKDATSGKVNCWYEMER